MSETPGGPEYYTPPTEPAPTPPPPPSITDAAREWTLEQGQDAAPEPFSAPQQAYAPSSAQQPYPYQPPGPRPAQGLAITALVLGIVALVTGWIPGWGVLVGLAAIVFGIIALAKRQGKGMAIGGIVTGVLGLLSSVLIIVFIAIGWNATEDSYDDFGFGSPTGTTLGPEPVDGGLAVSEQAFGTASWDATVVWYVVILDNPSDAPYMSSEITVNALDASGQIIDSSWNYVTLPSGQTALGGSFYDLGSAGVASLEVVGPSTDSLSGEPAAGSLTSSPLTVTSDDWSTTVSGTVTSSFEDEAYGPTAVVVARDAGGAIIGSAQAWVDSLPAGSTQPFEAIFYEAMPDGATYEVFWTTY
jgi:hypothetical protein